MPRIKGEEMTRIQRINNGNSRVNAYLMRTGGHTRLVLMRVIFVSRYPRIIRIACVEKEVS